MAKKSKGMAEPRNIEGSKSGKDETQKYHEGSRYYGKGYGKFANLPQEPDLEIYPNPFRSLDNEAYPDTLELTDADQRYNDRKVDERRSRSMY